MTVSVTDLVAELKTLRKGRGIHAPHITERIGPNLRVICSIAENEEAAAVRQKLEVRLKDLASRLPPDLQVGVVVAFGLEEALHTQFYKDRLVWAENKMQRNSRTVRRRIDEAIDRIAELAVTQLTPAGDAPRADVGWHNVEIRQVLRLDQPDPYALELRRIMSDEDELDELNLSLTITAPTLLDPSTRPDVETDVVYGGRLRSMRMESSDRIGFRLDLPRPLRLGEVHEFALRHRTVDGTALEPHFVCVPRHPCDVCEVRVRFAEDRPPSRLERLDAVVQRDIADPNIDTQPLELDAVGEVLVRFTHLTPNLAYGVRWILED